jgi:hypothetical protein
MVTFSQSASDSDQDHNNNPSQTDNTVPRIQSAGRLSFEQSSLTSDSGGGGSGGRQISSPPVVEGQTLGIYWESRDLSRRPNIHRSHLSSSIQTGVNHQS